MARQNIDEKWKTDPRRKALVKRLGSERLADGMRVEINWLVLDHRGQAIPLKEFKFIDDYQHWIECGLADVRGDFVHVAGADRYEEYFRKQSENAKKPRKPKPSQTEPDLASASQIKPEKPSYSSSSSSSKEEIYTAIPIIVREGLERNFGKTCVLEALDAVFLYHANTPASQNWNGNTWGKVLVSWLIENKRRNGNKKPKLVPETGGYGDLDGVS